MASDLRANAIKIQKISRQIPVVVQERNQNYDRSPTFPITVYVSERNFPTICHSSLLVKNCHAFLISGSAGCVKEIENCMVA